MSYNTDKPPCIMQPDNAGLGCTDPGENFRNCLRCGWNPEIAQQRRTKTLQKIAKKEKENTK